MFFVDRQDAGEQLVMRLGGVRGQDVVVMGLPRGGIPVAARVAEDLGAPLDVCLVRKLGVPFQPELAMGAIGEDGVLVVHRDLVRAARVSAEQFADIERREQAALERMRRAYRGGHQPLEITGRTVVLVDDGMATGASAQAACQVLRERGAARIVLAVPVSPPDVVNRLREVADEVVCAYMPRDLTAIGLHYAQFSAVGDAEVVDLLERAAKRLSDGAAEAIGEVGPREEQIEAALGPAGLPGRLDVPEHAHGIVVFAHGAGSRRTSPRNQYVARQLNRAGLGTLLFDLLTEQESADRRAVFDIELLAARLTEAIGWVRDRPGARGLPLGLFGASTGAAAALWAAAESGTGAGVSAVVSRGGRPDLADARLADVSAPTLLIVGSRDHTVLELNRRAQRRLRCENRLVLVPGATHLFEEPRALAVVAGLAGDWFTDHLRTT
jgi:putative phosphoribosyl transferase